MTTSGPNAWPSLSCAAKTLNDPIATPAISARPRPDGPGGPNGPDGRVAHPRHEDDRHDREPDPEQDERARGRPSRTIPAVTGMSAAITPVTGATIPIRPTASPRYSALIPMPPVTPPSTLQPRSAGSGAVSPRAIARTSARAIPTTCETRTTPNSGVRRVEQAATEVATPPGERGDQAEDDGRRSRRVELVQARRPGAAAAGAGARVAVLSACAAGTAGAPVSTLVGPSRTTTASAASS